MSGRHAHHDAVILVDGACNLCHRVVRFIVPRDPQGHFAFAALQSPVAKELLEEAGKPALLHAMSDARTGAPGTIVLIDDTGVHTRSEAVLRIARRLSGPWPLLAALRLVPRPMRDAAYRAVAARRYAWFGRVDPCRPPSDDVRSRFLD
jgi:predicted DCC family thiol-disulfide oxidoreductase YuxK